MVRSRSYWHYALIVFLAACAPRETPIAYVAPPTPLAVAKPTLADAERLQALAKESEEKRFDYASALDQSEQALHIVESLGDPMRVGHALLLVARQHWWLGHFDEADAILERATTFLPEGSIDRARARALHGAIVLHQRRYVEARTILEEAKRVLETTEGVDVEMVEVNESIGNTYFGLTDYSRAVTVLKETIAYGEARFGVDAFVLAGTYGSLGNALLKLYKGAEAKVYLEKCLELREKQGNRYLSPALNNLALLYHDDPREKDYDKAEMLYRRAVAITERTYGTDDVGTGQEYMNLGGLLIEKGNGKEGDVYFKRGLEIFQNKLGQNHPEYGRMVNWYESLRRYRH